MRFVVRVVLMRFGVCAMFGGMPLTRMSTQQRRRDVDFVFIVIMSMRVCMNVMLAVFHAVNDRARRHKEQRLEECVGDQVESGGDVRADAERRHHKAKL